ncbi:P-loop containing nucleoside triphosphate hydrolase protein [Mycena leptocephala]|nr:P-loop containing nucleoside triphosphate hydrolase protein [Mycena leptocephala]
MSSSMLGLDVGKHSALLSLCFWRQLIVSPLSALMIDQAQSSKIPTVAVCSETLTRLWADQMYTDIVSGKFRQVIVSPEMANSLAFRKSTLSKPAFTSRLRCVCIDEAHCISLWGGSFRPDYADLGLLRGRIPSNVPFVVASATLPTHILDDVCTKLELSKNATQISLTNARPNVALSCRTMKHPEESKADLRFLINSEATKLADIPVTLMPVMHFDDGLEMRVFLRAASPSTTQKLGKHKNAVGMGCDMRNIERVVLWGLPPSFCSLVQRAGRAARDFSKMGEAILIILASVIKNGVSETDIEAAVGDAANDAELENRGLDTAADLLDQGIELTSGHEEAVVGEGGNRASKDSDEEDGDGGEVKHKRRKKQSKECNSREADFLSRFACTTKCRRKIWDLFFDNDSKAYQPLPGMRCCDNCEPRLFEVEDIALDKVPGLRRRRKKEMDKELANLIRVELMDWREGYLLDEIYPGTTIISAGTVLGDDVIEQLVKQRVEEPRDLRRQTRWALGFQDSTFELSNHGEALFRKLQSIYEAHDTTVEAERKRIANLPPITSEIKAASFYAGTTRRTRNTPRDDDGYMEPSSRGRGEGVVRRSGRRGRKVTQG